MIADDRGSGVAPLPRRWLPGWVVVHVTGPSMSPTLKDGDRVLVRRLGRGRRGRSGDVVVARFPARPELLVVKRVEREEPGGSWVVGDNAFIADDSRKYGLAVPVGRVVARLWPRPGRIPGPPPDVGDLLD